MDDLVAVFQRRFPPPQPLRLVIHDTGAGRYLRWRRGGHAGRYLGLSADDDLVLELLAGFPPVLTEAVLSFERRARRLNAAYSASAHEARVLSRCLAAEAELTTLHRRVAFWQQANAR
jgi:hypothetical protein